MPFFSRNRPDANRNRYATMMFKPDRRLDYIRVAPAGEQPVHCVFASNHYGVVANLRL